MNVRSIPFSADNARLLMDKRKRQTRRIVDAEIVEYIDIMAGRADDEPHTSDDLGLRYCAPVDPDDDDDKEGTPQWCVYSAEYPEEGVIPVGQGFGAVGDLLWVQEPFAQPFAGPNGYIYRADADEYLGRYRGVHRWSARDDHLWCPDFEMPREASRATLELTSVRIERLSEITPDDAKAEGYDSVDAFLNGSWASRQHRDAWVWVLGFDVHLTNVDEFLKARAA